MNELKVEKLAQVDLDDAGDIAVFSFVRKAKVLRAGLLITTADTTAAAIEIDKRILAGSDTGRTAAIDTVTKPASNQQGKYIYASINTDVDAGDQLVFQVSVDPATAVTAIPVIEYVEEPESQANLTDTVETA